MADREELPSASNRPGPPASGATDAGRWARVKAVCLEALERPEPERAGFVERACGGDADLRDEVLSLLANEKAAASFGETPATALLHPGSTGRRPDHPSLDPGTRLGAYEILEFLSAGGMGEVYRARHTVLSREVAIKTVSTATGERHTKRRLIREARHASVLSHPHICTIHEVGGLGGTPFIVMALVEGRPLNEIVGSGVPPLERTLDYAIQVASALEHAHQHGIVHRDLKSANVMVDADDRVVVLDFGLSRRLPGTTGVRRKDAAVTASGVLAGTPGYMAPEVLRGRRADPRSDIWSLGVLLYELLTGALPFQGQTPFETTSAILNEPPRPLTGRTPLALRLVIERCLAKNPAQRYQTAAELQAALEAIRRKRSWTVAARLVVRHRRRTVAVAAAALLLLVATVTAAPELGRQPGEPTVPGISTLAFLPLENTTDDADLEYYAAGLTDALLGQLGAAADVRLISPGSTARAARDGLAPAAIARTLGADAIVTGGLRHASDRIVVDVDVVGAADGRVLWSDRFERGRQEVLALQADVVRSIAAGVELTMRPGSLDRLASSPTIDPEAYEAYLRGRFHLDRWTPAGTQLAREYFQRAIELSPDEPLAYVGLGEAYLFHEAGLPPTQGMPMARELAMKALELDATRGEVHGLLAQISFLYEWDWRKAEEQFERALALNPGYAETHHMYSHLLLAMGRFEESLVASLRAMEIDPLSPTMGVHLGVHYRVAGELDRAVEQFHEVLRSDPTYSEAHWHLGVAYWIEGRHDEAIAAVEAAVALEARPKLIAYLANFYARVGRTAEAEELLEELRGLLAQRYVPPYFLALVHDGLGEVEEAMQWLETAYAERDWFLHTLDFIGSPVERLRPDPRFRDLLTRLNLGG